MNQPGDVVVLFLPMAHSYAPPRAPGRERIAARPSPLVADVARVPEALATVQPTVLPAVPRVYEKIHANALGEIERAGGMHTADRALGVSGRARGRAAPSARGRTSAAVRRKQQRLADKLVFAKVRAAARRHASASVSPVPRRSRST